MTPTSGKFDSLQIIRALAMLLVLFAHIDIFSNAVLKSPYIFGLFRLWGGAGVDLFFVLSGFIITFIHKKDIGKKAKSVSYLIKRFTRIYPTYWVVNLIIIPIHFLMPQFGAGDETHFHKILTSIFLFPDNTAPIVHAGWTLSNEVYFYLMFGLLITLGFKKFIPLMLIIIIGTFVQSLIFLQGYVKGNEVFPNPLIKLIFSYYNIEFLLGCISAYLVTKYKIHYRKFLLILGITIFIFIGFYEWIKGDVESFRVYLYGIPSFFIITGLSSIEINNPKALLSLAQKKLLQIPNKYLITLLVFLGDASFSIYVTHQLLISSIGRTLLTLGFTNIFGMIITLIVITIFTLIMGCIFHLLVEKPLWNYSKKRLLSKYASNT